MAIHLQLFLFLFVFKTFPRSVLHDTYLQYAWTGRCRQNNATALSAQCNDFMDSVDVLDIDLRSYGDASSFLIGRKMCIWCKRGGKGRVSIYCKHNRQDGNGFCLL